MFSGQKQSLKSGSGPESRAERKLGCENYMSHKWKQKTNKHKNKSNHIHTKHKNKTNQPKKPRQNKKCTHRLFRFAGTDKQFATFLHEGGGMNEEQVKEDRWSDQKTAETAGEAKARSAAEHSCIGTTARHASISARVKDWLPTTWRCYIKLLETSPRVHITHICVCVPFACFMVWWGPRGGDRGGGRYLRVQGGTRTGGWVLRIISWVTESGESPADTFCCVSELGAFMAWEKRRRSRRS